VVETVDGRPTVVLESAGGTKGTAAARNTEYVQGLDVLLERLGALGAQLTSVHLDTDRTKHLPIGERTLKLGTPFPIDLGVAQPAALRAQMVTAMSSTGRSEDAGSGGGNPRRRIRLLLDGVELTDRDLADVLAFGVGAAGGRVSQQAFGEALTSDSGE
jgi:hypothetical protein